MVRAVQFFENHAHILTETPASYEQWKQFVEELGVSGVAVHDAKIAAVMNSVQLTNLLTFNTADFRRYHRLNVKQPAEIIREHTTAE